VTREEFVARYGNIYEHSAWVAQRAYDGGAEEGDDLATIFRRIVERAEPEAHLRLLREHPDLAGKLGTALTAESAEEQAGAGLDRCTPEEFALFQDLNKHYKTRFGFPFIIAVKGLNRHQILETFKRRAGNDRAHEFAAALEEVHKIAAMRLAAFDAPPEVPSETVTLDDLAPLVTRALAGAGADEENASAIVETVMAAERDGTVSHGVFRVAGYVGALKSGLLNGKARPRLLPGPDGAIIADGDGGTASLAYRLTLPLLAERAETHGAAVLTIRNTVHYAAMWHEVEFLAERGLAAFACTANFPYVAPHGGRRAFFGTNPIAFAYPRKDGPVAFDFAVSTMARGVIQIAARDGVTMPPGVGFDADGAPTRDPAAILKGAQTAFGAHKGSAIALMVEMLAAGLTGDIFSDEASAELIESGVPRGGVFVLAVSPTLLGGADALDRGEAFFQRLAAEPGVRLPGESRYARRRSDAPYTVPVAVMDELRALAEG